MTHPIQTAGQPFPFRRLFLELRMKIYSEADLEIQSGNNALPILRAFCKSDLYEEVVKLYKQSNYVVTNGNQEQFKKMKMVDPLKIKYSRTAYEAPLCPGR
jgi:hypothetical protein